MKCERCNLASINHVMFHDMLVHKCSKCGYVKVNVHQYNLLMALCINEKGIGNSKNFIFQQDVEYDEKIARFKKFIGLDAFRSKRASEDLKCNVCTSGLVLFENRYFPGFKFLYCDFCNSIFFKPEDFNLFLDLVSKKVNRPTFFEFLKEIFHKVKNNVKK